VKKILIALGALFLVLIVVGGSLISYFIYQGTKLDTSSKAYVDENVPKIVSGWSTQNLIDRASPELLRAVTPIQAAKLFQKLSALGPLRKYQGSIGQAGFSYTSKDGKVISANYVAKADFAKGEAEINIKLIQHNGSWQVLSFYVNSPLFLK
jgi:predicted PurR-regulated permease PerM